MSEGTAGARQITWGDETLDRIAAVAERCVGANGGNPRYFAEMFAATMCCNGWQERVVLEELEIAVRRIEDRQALLRYSQQGVC